MAKKKGIFKKIIFGIVGITILSVIVVIINLIIFEKSSSVVSNGQPIENYNEQNCALLVIDVQEATTGEVAVNSFYSANSDTLIKNINRITETFKNGNSLVIYIRSEISNPLINLLNNSFAKGSFGVKFDKRLNSGSGLEVVKSKNDAFAETELDSILTSNKIGELYIVGLDAAYCINITTEAAQNRNYKVNLIKEAVLSESEIMKDSMMISFRERGIKTISIDSINIMQ